MSQDNRPRGADGADSPHDHSGVDRLELHYRQQLSALVDGALAPDEARFLLRRLEHDQDLSGSYERWQLYGQVMRGQAVTVAAPDFAARVAAAVAEAPLAATGTGDGRRRGWVRWGGGGAALAASVAVVALFMGQARDPGVAPGTGAPVVASSAPELPAPPVEEAAPVVAAAETAPAAEAARFVAAAEPAAASLAAPRRAARPQPVVREPLPVVASVREMVGPAVAEPATSAVAAAAAPAAQSARAPFASVAPLVARPWPRAALPQGQASGAFTASFGSARAEGGSRPFYPFEP